jgi:hypothetical protein
MKTAIVVITLSLLVTAFLIYFLINYSKITYRKSRTKIKDRDFLKLFVEHDQMLSVKQLMKLSKLTYMEASVRVQSWMNNYALRLLQSSDGQVLYQLNYKMPTAKNHIFDIKRYDDEKIMDIVLNHIEGVELSPAHFVWLFDISIQEARKVLKRLVEAELVRTNLDAYLQRKWISNINPLGQREKYEDINEDFITEDGRIPLNDADLLQLAIEKDGCLTPAIVCLEKKIPLDDAQDLLDELYEKGAFYLEVDEKDGTIEYKLRETKLYKK